MLTKCNHTIRFYRYFIDLSTFLFQIPNLTTLFKRIILNHYCITVASAAIFILSFNQSLMHFCMTLNLLTVKPVTWDDFCVTLNLITVKLVTDDDFFITLNLVTVKRMT